MAWTPEQDLEESSSEEEPPLNSKLVDVPGAKLTTRGQLFSTLPRERIDEGLQDSGSLFNSLRRPSNPSDSNWLLSRSVPGSLNNGHASLLRTTSGPSSPDHVSRFLFFYFLFKKIHSLLMNKHWSGSFLRIRI